MLPISGGERCWQLHAPPLVKRFSRYRLGGTLMHKLFCSLTATAVLAVVSGSALAAGYPERAITMVVPFAAGGPTDTVTRLVAESMSKDLGQQIVVENVGGAGGTL